MSKVKKAAPQKSAPKKTSPKKAAPKKAPPKKGKGNISLTKWRAVCEDCNKFKTKRIFDSADEAIEFGVENHGDANDHVINAEQ